MNPTFIDDRDPKITYAGTWNQSGTPNEHNGTVSSSINVGDHFSVPFTGTSIGVYGTFNSSSAGVNTSYKIDGGPITTVPSDPSAKDSYQQLFWQSNPLRTGPHILLVKMVAVNNKAGPGEGTVWFDYFNVTHARSPSPSSPKKTSHAALVGGVTAGVVVLIMALSLLFLYNRRRKRKYKSTPSAPSTTPLPFPATMAESGPSLAASSGKRGRPNPSSGVPETAPDTHTPAPSSYGRSESAASQSQSHGLGT